MTRKTYDVYAFLGMLEDDKPKCVYVEQKLFRFEIWYLPEGYSQANLLVLRGSSKLIILLDTLTEITKMKIGIHPVISE